MNDTNGATVASESAESLAKILDRLDRIEGALARLSGVADQVPALAAVAADVFDEGCRHAKVNGIDIDARIGKALGFVVRLSEPETMKALEALVDRLPLLNKLSDTLESLPGMLAVLGDIVDEWAADLVAQGIDPETALRQGLHAALWLGQRVSESELERLGILLRSDVLDPHALAVVSKTGRALATSHESSCDTKVPERIGPVGLLRSLLDPGMQRTLGFVVRVGRCFGEQLPQSSDLPKTDQNAPGR